MADPNCYLCKGSGKWLPYYKKQAVSCPRCFPPKRLPGAEMDIPVSEAL